MSRHRLTAPFLAGAPHGLTAADVAAITREVDRAAARIRTLSRKARGDMPRFMGLRIVAGMLEHEVRGWAGRIGAPDTSAAFLSSDVGRA